LQVVFIYKPLSGFKPL